MGRNEGGGRVGRNEGGWRVGRDEGGGAGRKKVMRVLMMHCELAGGCCLLHTAVVLFVPAVGRSTTRRT